MISIITCSIDPQILYEFRVNIAQTIGCEYELIEFDNSIKKWGLCKVYNYCAARAKYNYICFVHEDMYFLSKGWGPLLINFYSERPNCGIVGFAGAKYLDYFFVQWRVDRMVSKVHTCVYPQKKLPVDYKKLKRFYNNHKNYDRVVVLDGMFMFTSKRIWQNVKFDEEHFKGFHMYDVDFSFSVSLKYDNYVCARIASIHRCNSSFSGDYINELLVFLKKRRKLLPYYVDKISRIHSWLIRNHEVLEFQKYLSRSNISKIKKDEYKTYFRDGNDSFFVSKTINYFYEKLMNIKIRRVKMSDINCVC